MRYESHKEFDSITALARHLDGAKYYPGVRSRSSHTNRPDEKWDLGMGYEASLEMAAKGGTWAKGAEQLMSAHVDLTNLKSEGRVDALDTDVAGFFCDVPAFVAGVPDNMLSYGDDEQQTKPILRVGVHIGRSAATAANEVVRRGAAILSCIDDIEDQGFRVELWALWRNSEDNNGADFRVLVKAADEQWSPQSVAFAICHPAFSRRLMFFLCETENLPGLWSGKGREWKEGAGDDFDVYFRRQGLEDGSRWDNTESALMAARDEFHKQLTSKEQ